MNETKSTTGFHTEDFVAVGEPHQDDGGQMIESHGGAQMVREEHPAQLFNAADTDQMRTRWKEIQGEFVDDPRTAVSSADELVASAIKRLAEIFAAERDKLEQQWDRGGDVSTEDLRQVLHRYRSFFNRLLSV